MKVFAEISVISRLLWKNECYDFKAVLLFRMGQ